MVCSCAMPSNSFWLGFWLQIIFCSCVKKTVLFSFLRSLLRENVFARWSNDKTIIELGYRKISWFVSVSKINYLPKPNWSARHRQTTIFCSTSSNNCEIFKVRYSPWSQTLTNGDTLDLVFSIDWSPLFYCVPRARPWISKRKPKTSGVFTSFRIIRKIPC